MFAVCVLSKRDPHYLIPVSACFPFIISSFPLPCHFYCPGWDLVLSHFRKKKVCLLPLPSFLLWLVIILQRVSKRQVDCCHPRQHSQELVLSYHLQHLILFFLLTSKKETPLIIQQSIPSDFRSLLPSTCAHHFNNGVHYFTLESLITLWIIINLFNHCFFSLHSP